MIIYIIQALIKFKCILINIIYNLKKRNKKNLFRFVFHYYKKEK